MNALTFNIRLLEPLLVRQPGSGEENSGTGLGFIPGSVLRGFLINRYLKENPDIDPVTDDSCRRLFFDESVCCLNGYPNRRGERGLPRPCSWFIPKDDVHHPEKVCDFAVERDENMDSPKAPDGEFCWLDDEDPMVELSSPARFVVLHNASEERGIKSKENSTVFHYEAMAAGQVFSAAVVAENPEDLVLLRALLPEGTEDILGGSRHAGYGRVRFEKVRPVSDWCECNTDEDADAADVVIVTLLSDAILRDVCGQVSVDPVNLLPGLSLIKAFVRTRLVGGFNRKWRLPLSQTLAFAAGSVLVYEAGEEILQRLPELVKEGVGERRAEGFGRIAVNWHTRTKWPCRSFFEPRTELVELSSESRDLAKRMAERLLRAAIEEKMLAMMKRLEIQTPPTNAQLSRLRRVMHRAWQEGDVAIVARHLENLKAARHQLERARVNVGNKPLLQWLEEDVVKSDGLWEKYLKPDPLPAVAGVCASLTANLKTEYAMRLLAGLLKKTMKLTDRTEVGQTGGDSVL